jgi:hypothetical protein
MITANFVHFYAGGKVLLFIFVGGKTFWREKKLITARNLLFMSFGEHFIPLNIFQTPHSQIEIKVNVSVIG